MSERAKAPRVEGIDVARGLASAIMIQGHAYDGWADDDAKRTAFYAFTRVLGTLPLPSFLVLAGAAVALRAEAAIAKREDPSDVRGGLVRRGMTVLAIGYAVNVVSALMDGWEGPETFFRADVLPLIGLSIAVLASMGIRRGGDGLVDRRGLAVAGAVLAIVPVALCPWVTTWSRGVTGVWSYPLGLVAEVPGVTRMPFMPLASWAGCGALLGLGLARSNRTEGSVAGAPTRVLVGVLFAGLAIVATFSRLTDAWEAASEEPLSRAHPAVVANAIELVGRAMVVLAVGALATPWLPERVKRVLMRVGRGSMVAYVFHVPFCYGALGLPLRGRLDMLEATAWVIALEAASFTAVWARDVLRDAVRARRSRGAAVASIDARP